MAKENVFRPRKPLEHVSDPVVGLDPHGCGPAGRATTSAASRPRRITTANPNPHQASPVTSSIPLSPMAGRHN